MNFIDEIKESGLKQFWSKRPATEEEIASFENDFSVAIPNAYKMFLKTFGCGVFGHTEIYGLGCPETGLPNVRFVIEALKKYDQVFPRNVIPISDAAEGFYTCVLCEAVGGFASGNVVVCRPASTTEIAQESMQFIAENFECFCKREIASQKKC